MNKGNIINTERPSLPVPETAAILLNIDACRVKELKREGLTSGVEYHSTATSENNRTETYTKLIESCPLKQGAITKTVPSVTQLNLSNKLSEQM